VDVPLLYVRTEWLYTDIKNAIKASGLHLIDEVVTDVTRPVHGVARQRDDNKRYDFTVAQLVNNLAGHQHSHGVW
jgi:hypothetical protein